MAINTYFTESGGTSGQKSLYEDLIIEAIQIYGQTFHYIPREVLNEDTLFGEDQLSQFTTSYEIEMYVENKEGFNGGEIFQKFGVEIRDDASVIVSKSRWYEEVVTIGGEDLIRPREGDLLYFPTAKALFEINFVEHEKPFYQLQNLPVYQLTISAFEYSGEKIDLTDIPVDESDYAPNYALVVDDSTGFVANEMISQLNGTITVTAEIQRITGNTLYLSNVSNDTSDFVLFAPTIGITGLTSAATATVVSITPYDSMEYESNSTIQTLADGIVPFDPDSPFGGY